MRPVGKYKQRIRDVKIMHSCTYLYYNQIRIMSTYTPYPRFGFFSYDMIHVQYCIGSMAYKINKITNKGYITDKCSSCWSDTMWFARAVRCFVYIYKQILLEGCNFTHAHECHEKNSEIEENGERLVVHHRKSSIKY